MNGHEQIGVVDDHCLVVWIPGYHQSHDAIAAYEILFPVLSGATAMEAHFCLSLNR